MNIKVLFMVLPLWVLTTGQVIEKRIGTKTITIPMKKSVMGNVKNIFSLKNQILGSVFNYNYTPFWKSVNEASSIRALTLNHPKTNLKLSNYPIYIDLPVDDVSENTLQATTSRPVVTQLPLTQKPTTVEPESEPTKRKEDDRDAVEAIFDRNGYDKSNINTLAYSVNSLEESNSENIKNVDLDPLKILLDRGVIETPTPSRKKRSLEGRFPLLNTLRGFQESVNHQPVQIRYQQPVVYHHQPIVYNQPLVYHKQNNQRHEGAPQQEYGVPNVENQPHEEYGVPSEENSGSSFIQIEGTPESESEEGGSITGGQITSSTNNTHFILIGHRPEEDESESGEGQSISHVTFPHEIATNKPEVHQPEAKEEKTPAPEVHKEYGVPNLEENDDFNHHPTPIHYVIPVVPSKEYGVPNREMDKEMKFTHQEGVTLQSPNIIIQQIGTGPTTSFQSNSGSTISAQKYQPSNEKPAPEYAVPIFIQNHKVPENDYGVPSNVPTPQHSEFFTGTQKKPSQEYGVPVPVPHVNFVVPVGQPQENSKKMSHDSVNFLGNLKMPTQEYGVPLGDQKFVVPIQEVPSQKYGVLVEPARYQIVINPQANPIKTRSDFGSYDPILAYAMQNYPRQQNIHPMIQDDLLSELASRIVQNKHQENMLKDELIKEYLKRLTFENTKRSRDMVLDQLLQESFGYGHPTFSNGRYRRDLQAPADNQQETTSLPIVTIQTTSTTNMKTVEETSEGNEKGSYIDTTEITPTINTPVEELDNMETVEQTSEDTEKETTTFFKEVAQTTSTTNTPVEELDNMKTVEQSSEYTEKETTSSTKAAQITSTTNTSAEELVDMTTVQQTSEDTQQETTAQTTQTTTPVEELSQEESEEDVITADDLLYLSQIYEAYLEYQNRINKIISYKPTIPINITFCDDVGERTKIPLPDLQPDDLENVVVGSYDRVRYTFEGPLQKSSIVIRRRVES